MHLKGQIWYLDVFFALFIFTGALIFFFKSDIDFLSREDDILEQMDREGRIISESLMGPGYPDGWNSDNVIDIGIVDSYRVRDAGLSEFGRINYNTSRTLLRTSYDYYLFFEDNDGPIWVNATQEGFGKPGISSANILDEDPFHLLKIVRFVIFRSEPVRMVIYLWI